MRHWKKRKRLERNDGMEILHCLGIKVVRKRKKVSTASSSIIFWSCIVVNYILVINFCRFLDY